jgi:hypothetical protein
MKVVRDMLRESSALRFAHASAVRCEYTRHVGRKISGAVSSTQPGQKLEHLIHTNIPLKIQVEQVFGQN